MVSAAGGGVSPGTTLLSKLLTLSRNVVKHALYYQREKPPFFHPRFSLLQHCWSCVRIRPDVAERFRERLPTLLRCARPGVLSMSSSFPRYATMRTAFHLFTRHVLDERVQKTPSYSNRKPQLDRHERQPIKKAVRVGRRPQP